MKKRPEPAAVSGLRPKRLAGDGFQEVVERPYFDSVLSFQAPVPYVHKDASYKALEICARRPTS
jgi:hypothetical protein